MTTIYDERPEWKRDVALSLALHAVLTAGIIGISIYRLGHNGDNWGGTQSTEGTINATLVSSAPTIPLPAPKQPTENIVATENKGVAQPAPAPIPTTPPLPEPRTIDIPDQTVKPKPAPKVAEKPPPKTTAHAESPAKPSAVQPTKPQPANVVPYGEGGAVKANMAIVNTSAGQGAILVAGGDFGSKYSWYVDNVRRKVSDNWMKYEVDPHTAPGRRVYISFEVDRNGNPSNVRVEQPSGVASLDYSAVNAMRRIDTFGPLPNDYRGSYIQVQFYFDYKK
ncbi:MAG: TonB family protein [Acidobacteriaceae bacterium]